MLSFSQNGTLLMTTACAPRDAPEDLRLHDGSDSLLVQFSTDGSNWQPPLADFVVNSAGQVQAPFAGEPFLGRFERMTNGKQVMHVRQLFEQFVRLRNGPTVRCDWGQCARCKSRHAWSSENTVLNINLPGEYEGIERGTCGGRTGLFRRQCFSDYAKCLLADASNRNSWRSCPTADRAYLQTECAAYNWIRGLVRLAFCSLLRTNRSFVAQCNGGRTSVQNFYCSNPLFRNEIWCPGGTIQGNVADPWGYICNEYSNHNDRDILHMCDTLVPDESRFQDAYPCGAQHDYVECTACPNDALQCAPSENKCRLRGFDGDSTVVGDAVQPEHFIFKHQKPVRTTTELDISCRCLASQNPASFVTKIASTGLLEFRWSELFACTHSISFTYDNGVTGVKSEVQASQSGNLGACNVTLQATPGTGRERRWRCREVGGRG